MAPPIESIGGSYCVSLDLWELHDSMFNSSSTRKLPAVSKASSPSPCTLAQAPFEPATEWVYLKYETEDRSHGATPCDSIMNGYVIAYWGEPWCALEV